MRVLILLLLSFSPFLYSETPNIVILYADDMGFGDLACQNKEAKLTTPSLDKLATEGMRFTDGHSSSGICTPSRYALLTGNYHWRRMHGIVNSFGGSVFKPNEMTIARMLKSKGYSTAAIGKWHLGWNWPAIHKPGAKPQTAKQGKKKKTSWPPEAFDWSKAIPGGPLDQGFDYYFGDGTINFPPYCFVENDKVTEVPSVPLDLNGMQTKEGGWEFRPGPMVKGWDPYKVLPTLADKGVEYINRQEKGKPFFLYFAFPSPHAPIIPTEEFIGKTKAGAYGDFIYQTDHIAGRILDALEKKGLKENTLVIFTADNGPEKYAFNRIEKTGHRSPGPLRGLKRDIYEGGHRVPFIIRWPGKVKAGSVCDETVSQVDIMSTVAALTGHSLKSENAVDSYNMLPILKGEDYKKPLREATIQNTYSEKYAVRKGKWILINTANGHHSKAPEWYMKKNGYKPALNKKYQLFDLNDDLGQKKDIADQNPEVVKELQAILKKYRSSGRSVPERK